MAYQHNRHHDTDEREQQPRARFNKNEFKASQRVVEQPQASEPATDVFLTTPARETRPPRHEVNRNTSPRDTKFNADIVSLRDFEDQLRQATWVLDIDPLNGTFQELVTAQKAQTDLYYTAYRNGAKHMKAWYNFQITAMHDKIRQAVDQAVQESQP